MPPLKGWEHLLGYLFTPGEVGIMMAGSMGSGPLTHGELRQWQKNTGVRLTPFEAKSMVALSTAYLAQSHKAEKRDCRAPWKHEEGKPQASETQLALRALSSL